MRPCFTMFHPRDHGAPHPVGALALVHDGHGNGQIYNPVGTICAPGNDPCVQHAINLGNEDSICTAVKRKISCWPGSLAGLPSGQAEAGEVGGWTGARVQTEAARPRKIGVGWSTLWTPGLTSDSSSAAASREEGAPMAEDGQSEGQTSLDDDDTVRADLTVEESITTAPNQAISLIDALQNEIKGQANQAGPTRTQSMVATPNAELEERDETGRGRPLARRRIGLRQRDRPGPRAPSEARRCSSTRR